MTIKGLDIGPRDVPVEGFDTLDCDPQWGAHHLACWGQDVLPFADDTYDVVYASHVLQFIPWRYTAEALSEVWRILRPGGTIEIWVPDFDYITAGMHGKITLEEMGPCKNNREWYLLKMFGEDPDWHKSVFGKSELEMYLETVGFKHVERKEVSRGFNHGKISLGVTAVKLLGDQDV